MSAATKRQGTCHTPATARIQSRLERLELAHLRELCAEQAAEIERLKREVEYADDCAEMWQRGHERLSEHLMQGTADARCIGLTPSGELLLIDPAIAKATLIAPSMECAARGEQECMAYGACSDAGSCVRSKANGSVS